MVILRVLVLLLSALCSLATFVLVTHYVLSGTVDRVSLTVALVSFAVMATALILGLARRGPARAADRLPKRIVSFLKIPS